LANVIQLMKTFVDSGL